MDIATSFTKLVDGDLPAMENAFLQIKQAIANRKPGDEEARYLLQFKAALRRAEARGACRFIGVPEERVHLLNLPFYETRYRKPMSILSSIFYGKYNPIRSMLRVT